MVLLYLFWVISWILLKVSKSLSPVKDTINTTKLFLQLMPLISKIKVWKLLEIFFTDITRIGLGKPKFKIFALIASAEKLFAELFKQNWN